MTWFRVDDGFSDHAKVHALQDSKHWKGALALWLMAGAWSAAHEKDGKVPSATVRRLGFSEAEAAALVGCSLWHEIEGGYVFHQWHERNPLRSELESKREQTRNKVSEWRETKKKPKCNPVTQPYVTGYADVGNQSVTSPPSQSLPSPFPDQDLASLDSRARPDPVDRLPEPEQGFSDRRMRSLFVAEFEGVQRSTPSMGGKNVGELHAMVCRTAQLQGSDPEALFVAAVRGWLAKPLEDIERRSPYACFAQSWGSLTARGASAPTGEPVTVESLRAQGTEALLRGDHATVAKLSKRITALQDAADRQVQRAR